MRTSENGTKVNVTVVSGKTGLPITDVQVSLYWSDWGRLPQLTQSEMTMRRDKEAASRRALELRAEGTSLREIGIRLAAEGILSRDGGLRLLAQAQGCW